MEHWKFRLPWYALLFPVSQLTLWFYLMRTILSDEVAGAAWIATGIFLLVLCAVADLLLFKALRQSTQLHMTVQRRQLMESSVETQRKRGEALERETAEAVHVRREISARLLAAAELLQNRRMEAARSCMDSIPRSVLRRSATALTPWRMPSFRKSWRCAAGRASRRTVRCRFRRR